jgi:hypothetical protein
MWLSRHGLDLNTPQGYQKTVDAIRALPNPPEIIVVDTLHRFLDGDENSASDAKSMLDACGAMIHEFDCSVILVHHTGVSVEAQHRARGSSAWRGALDIEISVIPGDTIEINQRKSKDAEEAQSVFVELQLVPIKGWLDEDGDQVSSAVLAEGNEPVKAKKDSPIQNQMKVFENGWWDSGAEDIDGDPYLTKAAFGTYFEKQGYELGTVKNYLKPSFKTGPIAVLIQGGIISAHQSGWIVLDKVWSSAMMMSRGQR